VKKLVLTILFLSTSSSTSFAKVVRFDIEERTDVLDGRAFGLAGGYEKISGRVYFAVDSKIDPNLIITDIDKAPVNENGLVEFSSEFYILKPKKAERGNGSLLLEVANRGRKALLPFFNLAAASHDPQTELHFGDGFLMREGFTLIWVGWQWDTPEIEGRMRMFPPVATEDGSRQLLLVPGRPTGRLIERVDGEWKVLSSAVPKWATSATYSDGSLLVVGSPGGALQFATLNPGS